MKRFALAALTLAALGLGMIDGRPAAAQPGGAYLSAPEYVGVQYRPYYHQGRGYYRQDRRAEPPRLLLIGGLSPARGRRRRVDAAAALDRPQYRPR